MYALDEILTLAKGRVPFHRRRAPADFLDLQQWPLSSRADIAAYPLHATNDLLNEERPVDGYVLASGGTIAEPKYVHYTQVEFDLTSSHIARQLTENGLGSGDRVVNYFSAGDMWAAFLLADHALAKLPVTVLPLGYTPRANYAMAMIEALQPNAIIGIPSMLLELARHCREQAKEICFKKLYFAGESLTGEGEQSLRSIWRCEIIRSAGYATTDVGAIGWQCRHCAKDEYIPMPDIVIEIIEREIVATSLSRIAMPVVRYRTGDRGHWVAAGCDCGNGAQHFRLQGRLDDVLIIWGCWISYFDVASALTDLGISFSALQLEAVEAGGRHGLNVYLETGAELPIADFQEVKRRIYQRSEDLHGMVPENVVMEGINIGTKPPGALRRNRKTGKVMPILDARSPSAARGDRA